MTEISSHTHYKWPCPKSNGRHEWEWDAIKIYEILFGKGMISLPCGANKLAFPIRCKYGCGAYGIEWYEFKEIIEGE